ncbi:MAG: hypothetical protein V4598_15760 [Bdellovibrionota bacterium]
MKTKLLILLSVLISSQAFAVQYCTIKGTSDTVGIFPGDSSRKPSIYVKGRGYYAITKADYANEVYISTKNDRNPVVLDFKRRTLEIEDQVLKLVKCVQNGSE